MMGEATNNFESCCRLCLTDTTTTTTTNNNNTLKSIFDESNDNDTSLAMKISSSLAVHIKPDDKCTRSVCSICLRKLQNWLDFKQMCLSNQNKVEQWLQSSEYVETNIQIKEEPIEHDIDLNAIIPEVVMNGGTSSIKFEAMEIEFGDGIPPHLMPQLQVGPEIHRRNAIDSGRQCTVCEKVFSSLSNRKKHERTIHAVKPITINSADNSQDEFSQNSIDSIRVDVEPLSIVSVENDVDRQKIQFAAGLKLLQRNSTPPICQEALSKIEYSYIEKCKAMAQMLVTFKCACHNELHANTKRLLSHLRSLRIWFPVFTCYHCMITFTDRSSKTRHHLRCPRTNFETLIKLSNLRKRSEVKTRLYQIYKCTKCHFMYSFHQDFCTHVDEDHCDVELPVKCSCGRSFNTIEDYKDHAYVSCLVDYYCDICFFTVKTLDEFQKHAAENHDNSEGFVLLQDDNYRRRKLTYDTSRMNDITSDPVNRVTRSSTGGGGGTMKSEDQKVELSPINGNTNIKLNVARPPGLSCPVCGKMYSTNNNMIRHYKTHLQDNQTRSENDTQRDDESLYCCPDCGGMFNTTEWKTHKEKHIPQKCTECGKEFQFKAELDQHRSVHLNLKVYKDSKTHVYKSAMLNNHNVKSSNGFMMVCEICDAMFTTKEQLVSHRLIHNNATNHLNKPQKTPHSKFYCAICDKNYAGYSGLWDHNAKKHPEIHMQRNKNFPRQCKYCDKVFTTGGSFAIHMQMHQRMQESLNQKMQSNNNSRSLKRTKDEEDAESYFTCKRCFKVFSSKSNYRNHMKCHGVSVPTQNHNNSGKVVKVKTKKVWCDICHAQFEDDFELNEHKSSEHYQSKQTTNNHIDVKVPLIFTCDICVQTFTTKSALLKHKERHMMSGGVKGPPTLFQCKYCRIQFKTNEQFINHMVKEHDEVKYKKMKPATQTIPKCKICGKMFETPVALYSHMGWHKRGNFSQNTKVSVVKKEKGLADGLSYTCKQCGLMLRNDTALQLHILEKHRNVNATVVPARCTLCCLDFNSQDEYDRHKAFHDIIAKGGGGGSSGGGGIVGKSYSCPYCPACFNKVEGLNVHLTQFHSKPEFRCHHCNRVFEKHNSLSIHLKVHEKIQAEVMPLQQTSKRLYSCSICNKGFDIPKELRQHTIEAHPF